MRFPACALVPVSKAKPCQHRQGQKRHDACGLSEKTKKQIPDSVTHGTKNTSANRLMAVMG